MASRKESREKSKKAASKTKQKRAEAKARREKRMDEFNETVRKNNALIRSGRGNQTRTVQERRDIKKNIEKAKESNKKNVTVKPSSPTAPKKFDYKNKSKTKFSASKARRAARGRTSADIANFEFHDKVRIKSLIYRVNKINYKPGDLSTVEFILIT